MVTMERTALTGMLAGRRILWTIALAALPLVAWRSASAQRCQACAGEDTVPRGHVLPGFGLRVGTPQKASVALGVVLGEDWQRDGRDHSRNIALFAEPGLSAGRASIAYVSHGYGSFGSGLGIAGTVLRTWKDPWTVKDNVTYAGGELLIWPILLTGPRIGLFHSIGGTETSKRWFVSFDFGIGL
jgi:hypothetical protein